MTDSVNTINANRFTMRLDAIGYWPRPKILYAGLSSTPDPLSQLVFDLNNHLTACGFGPEQRKYKPHVTLYRKALKRDAQSIESPIEWPIDEFVLAVSGGGESGSRYRVVRRWPLQPPVAI
jgi:RNA 2',3'-cyclic 3'-phosphodiesterase